ncbi:MAG: DUF4286 family protein [Oligoflexales bacterium]
MDIRLVTIDVLSSLILSRQQPGFDFLLGEATKVQADKSGILYEILLGRSIAKIARNLDVSKALPLEDLRALKSFASGLKLGLISGIDAEVFGQLGLSADFLLTRHSGGGQQSLLAAAERIKVPPANWLHITRTRSTDIPFFKQNKINLALIGEEENRPKDITELITTVRGRIAPRVRYEVTAKPSNKRVKEKFLTWMRDEHAADLLAIPGCTECRVYELDSGIVRCEYTFANQAVLDRYLEKDAATLRAKGAKVFKPGEIVFDRSVATQVLHY